MRKPIDAEAYFFIDESGDPNFYGRNDAYIVGTPGCSRIFILGFIETEEPQSLRNSVLDLHKNVVSDPFLSRLPSAPRTAVAFHANDDSQEVRYLVTTLIRNLDFKA